MILGREDIISKQDLEIKEVDMPEWGGSVRLKMLTGSERDAYEASIFKQGKQDFTNLRSKLLVRSIIDENGKRLFKDHELDVLGSKAARSLDRLFDEAQKLNGMSQKAAEELEKNSESGQSGDSVSGLQES